MKFRKLSNYLFTENYQISFKFFAYKISFRCLIKKITFYPQVFSSFYPIFLIERIRYILKEKLLCSQSMNFWAIISGKEKVLLFAIMVQWRFSNFSFFLVFFFTQIAHTNIFKFYVFYRKKNSWYQSFLLFIFYQSESQVLMSFHQNVWNEKSPVLDLRVAYQ